jgi:hypothetical protein
MDDFALVVLDAKIPALHHQVSAGFAVTHGFVVDD